MSDSEFDQYVPAGRKKRKKYIAICLSRNFDQGVLHSLNSLLKKDYAAFSISKPQSVEEFTKMFHRQIGLIIVDDKFADMHNTIAMIKAVKTKKHDERVPTLFITTNPKELIDIYNTDLLSYKDIDGYLDLTKISPQLLESKIKQLFSGKDRRRSRRYKTNLEANVTSTRTNKTFPVAITDISIHGATLEGTDHIFQENEQLQLHIPVGRIVPPQYGDFFRLSARIRRVELSGISAGISWEHMTEALQNKVTVLVTELVHRYYAINQT